MWKQGLVTVRETQMRTILVMRKGDLMYVFIAWDNTLSFYFWVEHIVLLAVTENKFIFWAVSVRKKVK